MIFLCECLHWPGIEPGSVPWQGTILPLDHQCTHHAKYSSRNFMCVHSDMRMFGLMHWLGIEPKSLLWKGTFLLIVHEWTHHANFMLTHVICATLD